MHVRAGGRLRARVRARAGGGAEDRDGPGGFRGPCPRVGVRVLGGAAGSMCDGGHACGPGFAREGEPRCRVRVHP
ncbi:hypothetical protein KCH_29680 [Kitasatospora cheerisanensis KCTC 2395]|uniref:Uncharacterized protein n=1 Tax=Kitasatospora cheerisanensis KCTC 2395 TaxID=1348663 RepID=A0A066YVW7_9ACTN|nr:hypothetical protein KCH_29680 [Kitasatospora cheerisanensis KCTC 2395]